MKIIQWNIQAGGGKRLEAIASTLENKNADILILTEFRSNKIGGSLSEMFLINGYKYVFFNKSINASHNGVLIASRIKCHSFNLALPPNLSSQIQCANISNKLKIIALFLNSPQTANEMIKCLSRIKVKPKETMLIIGDLYYGYQGSNLKNYNKLSSFNHAGYIDVWHSLNGKNPVWSHKNSRGGTSQPDHAFISANAISSCQTIKFDQTVLDRALSDHALMELTLNVELL